MVVVVDRQEEADMVVRHSERRVQYNTRSDNERGAETWNALAQREFWMNTERQTDRQTDREPTGCFQSQPVETKKEKM